MTPRSAASKIVSRTELVRRLGRPREGALVFTNGVFDLIHRGHATYLEAARALGDTLVVGVNSDASARRLGKGAGRPVTGETDRALLLSALECVDQVCLFDEDTPASLIEALLPDVLVKGGDYDLEGIVGRAAVEESGGRVEVIPLVEGFSTSDIVDRIQALDPPTA